MMAKAISKTAEKKSTSAVVKRMCSFPRGLFKYGIQRAKQIAAEQGKKRPNFSGYLTQLVYADKFSSSNQPANPPATPK